MDQTSPDFPGLGTIVSVLLAQKLHPAHWTNDVAPWVRLIERPCWRVAKPLFATHPELVSELVERLVADRPGTRSDTDAWMCLGMVRRRRGDFDCAMKAFARLVERDDDDVRAHYNVGLCRLGLGQTAMALSVFSEVLHRQPDNLRALMSSGTCRQQMGNAEGARAAFEKVLRLRPNEEDPWHKDARKSLAALDL